MTLHEVVTESRHASCATCMAGPDQPCKCPDVGVHYSRVSRACAAGYIPLNDFASAIHDDAYCGGNVLLDPEVNAA